MEPMHHALISNAARTPAVPWPASGTQFLPVSGSITDRLLVTYRAPAAPLAALVPEPFRLDVYAGQGFVSVCAVEILGMGIAGSPRLLRWDNREFLYRVGVRVGGAPTFITLRSDVSSRALALLGRHFSHYRPEPAQVALRRAGSALEMTCTTPDGSGDAAIEVDLAADTGGEESLFASAGAATNFLLGMSFSADAANGRVRVQPIDHSPWQPRFVPATRARFAFLERLGRQLGTAFTYDGTLATRGVQQVWRAARWL
jgi:uncharacterized protein YqjF (DUF2071 family)